MYTTVSESELHGFPSVLGLTSEGHTAADLHVDLGADGYWLTMECTEREGVDHPSTGIGEGLYALDTATLTDDVWMGAHVNGIRTGATPVNWLDHTFTNAVPDRAYPFLLSITAEAALQVRLRVEEHLADYLAAWDCSVGCVRWALGEITTPAPSPELALTWLTQVLVAQDLNYLVPADPHDLNAWGQRIRTVHMQLCGQSKKRDRRREHSPVRYTVWMDGGPPERVLYAPTEFGALHPDSYEYVVPSEIAVVYGGHLGGVAADPTVAAAATMTVGAKVAWVTDPPTLEGPELDVHPEPSDTSTSMPDVNAVKEAVRSGKATVHSLGEVHAWLEVHLADLGGDFTYVERTGEWGATGYIKLRKALLQPST